MKWTNISSDIFLTYLLIFFLAYLVTFFLTYLLTFFRTFLLTFFVLGCLSIILSSPEKDPPSSGIHGGTPAPSGSLWSNNRSNKPRRALLSSNASRFILRSAARLYFFICFFCLLFQASLLLISMKEEVAPSKAPQSLRLSAINRSYIFPASM